MIPRRVGVALIVAVGIVHLAVPLWMIHARERTLDEGSRWRFRVAPVDPADPFRGRYLALGFRENQAPVPPDADIDFGAWVYVPLERDEEGFARLGPVHTDPPAGGDFLRLQVRGLSPGDEGRRRAHFRLPFDRLYLEEEKARRAEERLREIFRARGGEAAEEVPVWAWVRVREGRAVLEDVEVAGRSIRALAGEP